MLIKQKRDEIKPGEIITFGASARAKNLILTEVENGRLQIYAGIKENKVTRDSRRTRGADSERFVILL